MKQYRYNSVIINVTGNINRSRIEAATKVFYKKVMKQMKREVKGVTRNGNIKR